MGDETPTKRNSLREPDAAIRVEAEKRVALEAQVHVNSAYETFYLGLRRNQEHGMAVVHPVTFIIRRLLYAVIIIHMQGESLTFFGAVIMLLTCLIMLCVVSIEH